jgi:adenosylcobyric acid synthase
MGISKGPALKHPAVQLKNKVDGVVSEDNQIIGTYLHGLFDKESALHGLLSWAGLEDFEDFDYEALREQELDRLADEMQHNLDINLLLNTCQQYKNQ